MTFAFIRHGQTDWNRDDKLQGSSDIPLNDTGREQAHRAARLLADGGWTVVVSSPLLRARETAEIISADLGIELGPSYSEFIERDYGELEGAPSSESMARYPKRDYPGAESLDSVVYRGLGGLAKVEADLPDDEVVIVCHGTIIRYTLAALARRPIEGITNGSISTIRFDNGVWTVLTVNGQPLAPAADVSARATAQVSDTADAHHSEIAG